ncbi:hypothetical protein F4777DRAFT_261692 [Nemania sp. FL0916]|nr:hypothetical protein F4777DRAFT_261692 [Nemania sp. FL0916]
MWRHLLSSRSRLSSHISKCHGGSHLSNNRANAVASQPCPAQLRFFTSGTLRYPDAPSGDQHHDLASYLAYAERTGLDASSKVFVGTHYEYTIARALGGLGFDLRRVGGHSDKGIDLLGTWRVPSAPTTAPLRVLIQCKAYSHSPAGKGKAARVGPQFVRELEGTYLGAPAGWRGSGVVALLVAQRPATKGVRDALAHSRWPLAYVSCSKDGALEQMLWNRRAEEEGLEGMGVAAKLSDEDRHGKTQSLVLTWKGRPYASPSIARTIESEVSEPQPDAEGDAEPTR